jgi:hypothetical protein
MGAAGVLAGAAARKLSARKEPDIGGGLSARWPKDAAFYWLVLTDRAMHVFRGTKDHPKVLDPNEALFALDEIESLEIGQSFGFKPMRFVFTDGSAVSVDSGAGAKIDEFVRAAQRAFSGGVTRDLKDSSGFWFWAWLGIFGLLLGALATGAGASTERGTASVVLSTVAAVCAVLATWWWVARWSRVRWKWWGLALTMLLLGGILTAASFDKESCDCSGIISLGAPVGVVGLSALGGRLFRRV